MENNSFGFPHQLNDLDLNLNDISNILAYSVMSIGKLYINDEFSSTSENNIGGEFQNWDLKIILNSLLGSHICSETSWLFLNITQGHFWYFFVGEINALYIL